MGIPGGALSLIYGKLKSTGEGHAVLAVHTDHGLLVLGSDFDTVLPLATSEIAAVLVEDVPPARKLECRSRRATPGHDRRRPLRDDRPSRARRPMPSIFWNRACDAESHPRDRQQTSQILPEEIMMRLGLIAISAAALLLTVGGASAQSATAGTGVGGTLCSDLLALDTTSQGAFLQGYQAAMQDQLVSAGTGVGAAAGMTSSSSMASTVGGASAGGVPTLNTASIVSNCKSSPTIPLSQALGGSGAGATSSAQ